MEERLSEELKEQIIRQKNEKIKKKNNAFLITVFIILVFGNFAFFTSKLWLPASYDDVKVTKIGEAVKANNREVTLQSWKYAPEERIMQVIVSISNMSTDGIKKYKWSVIDKNKGFMPVEVIIDKPDFAVLELKMTKAGWSELSLRYDADEVTPVGEEFQTMKFYTSKNHVETVTSLPRKTELDYRKDICDTLILDFQRKIKELEEVNAEKQTKIKEAQRRIDELTEKEKYQTEEEKAATFEKITSLLNEKAMYESEQQSNKRKMAEYTEKIELQEKLKKSYDEPDEKAKEEG